MRDYFLRLLFFFPPFLLLVIFFFSVSHSNIHRAGGGTSIIMDMNSSSGLLRSRRWIGIFFSMVIIHFAVQGIGGQIHTIGIPSCNSTLEVGLENVAPNRAAGALHDVDEMIPQDVEGRRTSSMAAFVQAALGTDSHDLTKSAHPPTRE